jgi:hypothetical protein
MPKIKLAEAILQRSDIQKNLEQLKSRLNNNSLRQENTKTPEDPANLLKEINILYTQLELIINIINEANNQTGLYKLLNKRDLLKSKLSALRVFLAQLSSGVSRYTKTEIAILPNYDSNKIQKEVDLLSKEFRLLDNQIQSQNWIIEVEI